MSKFAWYINRLRVMQPDEIVHRLGEQLTLKRLHADYVFKCGIAQNSDLDFQKFAFCSVDRQQLPELNWQYNPDTLVAEGLLSGIWKALGYDWAWSPERPSWHEGPDTHENWPQAFFNSIPYRVGNPYGDIRVAWEPSRLQQLIAFALVIRSGDQKYRQTASHLIENQFLSWIELNPPLEGIHYVSAMECALRILSVCYAFDMIRGELSHPHWVWSALLRLVKSHATLIEKRLSLHSSAGNHTIAECAGLIYAGILFPEFERAETWTNRGLMILEEEADRQILSDGGGIEQTFWYLLFITDLCGLVVKLLQQRSNTVSSRLELAFDRGKGFLNKLSDSPNTLFDIGDRDDGYALSGFLRLGIEEGDKPDLNQPFDAAGYTIIRPSNDHPFEVLFDHGCLGMAPSYGHGHADALSLIFRAYGKDILLDSGTYTYTGEQRWRAYFRSTRAHNTVTVDGLDQARQETAFSWSNVFSAKLVRSEHTNRNHTKILACHTGYESIGIIHWRGLVFNPSGFLVIWDYLSGEGIHDLELNWHLKIHPAKIHDHYQLTGNTEPIFLKVDGGTLTIRCGELDPICGWRSSVYGRKEPISTLQSRFQGSLPHEFVTKIWWARDTITDSQITPEISQFRKWIQ